MRFQTLFHQFFSSLLVFGMCLFLVLLSHTSLMLNCQICLVFFFLKKKNPPTYATCQAAPSTFPKPTYFLTEQVVYTPSRPFLKLSFISSQTSTPPLHWNCSQGSSSTWLQNPAASLQFTFSSMKPAIHLSLTICQAWRWGLCIY